MYILLQFHGVQALIYLIFISLLLREPFFSFRGPMLLCFYLRSPFLTTFLRQPALGYNCMQFIFLSPLSLFIICAPSSHQVVTISHADKFRTFRLTALITVVSLVSYKLAYGDIIVFVTVNAKYLRLWSYLVLCDFPYVNFLFYRLALRTILKLTAICYHVSFACDVRISLLIIIIMIVVWY